MGKLLCLEWEMVDHRKTFIIVCLQAHIANQQGVNSQEDLQLSEKSWKQQNLSPLEGFAVHINNTVNSSWEHWLIMIMLLNS